MKRTALAALVLTSLLLPVTLTAQTPPLKLGCVDTEKILLSSNLGKAAVAEVKKMQDQMEGEGRTRQKAIKDLQTALSEGRATLDPSKAAEMEKQLKNLSLEYSRFQDDATRALNKQRDDTLAAVDARVMPIINQYARDEKYSFIFRKFESGLIFADDAYDVTNAIIERLNAQKP